MDATAEAHLAEAQRLIEAGVLQRAYEMAAEVNRRFPHAAAPHLVIALVCMRRSAFPNALRALDRFAAATAATAQVEALRAQAHFHLRQPHEAIAAAQRAVGHPSADAQALLLAGGALLSLGQAQRALAAFQLAEAQDPNGARMHVATALHVTGALEEAEAAYRAVVKSNPREVLAWFSLTQLRSNALNADEVAFVRRLLDTTTKPEDALHLAHAVAKTLEDAGNHEAALEVLAGPKRQMRAARQYEFERSRRVFADARAPVVALEGAQGHPSDAPIFIVGLPRTGTTLLERILSAHPDVESASETQFFTTALRKVASSTPNAPSMSDIGAEYVRLARALAPSSPHFIDKMPLNFLYAEWIHRALPNARIIALRRGAADSCVANYAQFFSSELAYGYSFELADTARYYALFDELMAHWRALLPSSRFTELHYERLIANQEDETRRLLEFCGLSWDERCLAFNEQTSAVLTMSAAQVRKPLYATSIGRWKKYGAGLEPALAVLRGAGIAFDGPV